MLGIARWFVYGKHPCFADFFSIGEHSQIALAYKNWVIRGYEKYLQTNSGCRQNCSYRFWSKGGDEELLTVGLLQSSSDSVGRSFPLLVLGIVVLPSWHKKWRTLQQQLDDVWIALEEAAVGNHYKAPQNIIMALEERGFPAFSLVSCLEPVPCACFTGGCAGSNLEIFFDRPLTTDDFLLLYRGVST